MKRIETIPALLLLTAVFLLLQPSGVSARETGDACQGCHFEYYGSPTEVCMTCHEGALHHKHLYEDPGADHPFPNCGSPPDKCKCCHGDPPDYENPPVVADKCSSCHSVAGSDIVAHHNCSPFYDPDPGAHCLDCHGLTGIPHSRIVEEKDANNNCNDVIDNDGDCSRDDADSGCTGAAEDEICDDGLDNDFDELIDGEDPDCCGDGVVTPPEACDDGNLFDCDGCSETCEYEFCGDGKQCLALGEECEDGNTESCDGCSNTCKLEYCGDGVICAALGEECDGETGCGAGFTCDNLCTCREEAAASPCGASTTGMDIGDQRLGLNMVMLIVPLFLLLLLRHGLIRRREAVRTRTCESVRRG
jgi:cysteine-rich repeat protein